MDPKKKRAVAVTIAIAMLLGGSALAFGVIVTRVMGLEAVQDAYWYEDSGVARILVAGSRYESPESGSSYTRFGWVLVDPATGATSDLGWYADSTEFVGSQRAPHMLGTAGKRLVYVGESGLEIRDSVDGTGRSGAALARAYPSIAQPWFSAEWARPRWLLVESDDRRKWRIDLLNDQIADATVASQESASPSCLSLDWPKEDGTVWTFVHVEPARHSDPNDWALASARRVMYGQLEDTRLLDLRVPYASFVCDRRTDRTATFADGSALLSMWSGSGPARFGLARLTTDQRILWTWASDVETGPNRAMAALSHEGGFVVVIGTSVTSLDANGHVRWHTSL